MNPKMTPGAAFSVPLESTVLANATYNVVDSTLQLEFRSGAVYLYSNVPAAIYEALLAADSKGSFFSRQIRPVFPHVMLQPSRR
jgi:hypothetical protein